MTIYGASGNTITLAPTTASAGTIIADDPNSALYLVVTSTVTSSFVDLVETVDTRDITVSIDAAIPGFDIKVAAAAPTGGDGTFGTAVTTPFTLTTSPQNIVSGIGSCYTGVGTLGYNLTYSLVKNTYANIRAKNNAVTVTYTITI